MRTEYCALSDDELEDLLHDRRDKVVFDFDELRIEVTKE